MSFISSTRQGHRDIFDGDINEDRATAFWIVRYSAPSNPIDAQAASGVVYFQQHPDRSDLLCKQIRCRSVDEAASNRKEWELQADYSDVIQLPLSMPTEHEWDVSEANEPYFLDSTGAPALNSAGQPFDALPQKDFGSITCKVSYNVSSSFDPTVTLNNRQYVNSNSFTVDGVSISAWQAKISGISVSKVQYANTQYYRTVSYLFKFRDTWKDKIADMGTCQLDGSGKLIPITYGTPPQQAIKSYPLDGSGHAASTPTTTPATITLEPYQTTSMSNI